jgi:hypothetical protein
VFRDHHEPQTEEEKEAFRLRYGKDEEGFAHRWSLNRFANPNVARDLSPAERAQRDRETALLGVEIKSKPKKRRGKQSLDE